MVKYSVLYPSDGGKPFDHDYYRTSHMPMVKRLLGDACDHYEIDRGISDGKDAGAPPKYVCIVHIYSPSVEAFQTAIAPHLDEIFGDIPNYTTIVPTTQFSEVVAV